MVLTGKAAATQQNTVIVSFSYEVEYISMQIQTNDEDVDSEPVLIPKSLHAAMLKAKDTGVQYLWTDFFNDISINDAEEKLKNFPFAFKTIENR